jgi:hypothetical protein
MEDLIKMKQKLVDCVQGQISGNLENASAAELGEAVDMIKDLSEAIYYCTITDAMNKEKPYEMNKQPTYYYTEKMTPMLDYTQGSNSNRSYPMDYGYNRNYPTMYNNGGSMSSGSSVGNTGGSSYYHGGYGMPYNMPYEQPMMMPTRDIHEGNSPMYRKMYMEGKAQHKDKNSQMQELEKYMQELSQDITDMIKDASPEEKQLLQQKISTLSTKIR